MSNLQPYNDLDELIAAIAMTNSSLAEDLAFWLLSAQDCPARMFAFSGSNLSKNYFGFGEIHSEISTRLPEQPVKGLKRASP
jgi:hypothetical protein